MFQSTIASQGRTVLRGALSFGVALIIGIALANPSVAAAPDQKNSQAAAATKKLRPALPDVMLRVGPIAGAPPVEHVRPVLPMRSPVSAEMGPVETDASREQVLRLRDPRNLYRGPGSFFYMVRNTGPIAAPEQFPAARPEPTLIQQAEAR